MHPMISIIIVSYNTKDMTVDCLKSVFETNNAATFEVILVDNQSSDGSPEAIKDAYPDVKLHALNENLGFGRGNNYGAQHAEGKYILLLNPDTLIYDGTLDAVVEAAEATPSAAIWGGRTFFADGSLNPTSCWRFMSLRSILFGAVGASSIFRKSEFFNPEAYGDWDRGSVRQVDIVTGCFLMIERANWERLGGFDETFFMYAEEADLCYRARQAGGAPMITPDARLVHYGGASEPSRGPKTVRLLRGKLTFTRKHWSRTTHALAATLFKLHVFIRLMAYRALNRLRRSAHDRTSLEAWRHVWENRRIWTKGY